jgi:ring-1,2-phenylacetyl-CoA epoxidase subunit PaaD
MPDTHAIMTVLNTIPDPEMPLSIVELGMVEDVRLDGGAAAITVLPTFVGCPALPVIEDDIRSKIGAMPGVDTVDVRFVFDPPWSVDRISESGRAQLKAHGISVPDRTDGCLAHGQTTEPASATLTTSAITCPYCDSTDTRLDSAFGPTRCRTIFYCETCRNVFERMKRL